MPFSRAEISSQPSLKAWRHCLRFGVRGLLVLVLVIGSGLGLDCPPGPCSARRRGGVVLDYSAVAYCILNDAQAGLLQPPGLRMAEASSEVHDPTRAGAKPKS